MKKNEVALAGVAHLVATLSHNQRVVVLFPVSAVMGLMPGPSIYGRQLVNIFLSYQCLFSLSLDGPLSKKKKEREREREKKEMEKCPQMRIKIKKRERKNL